MESLSEDDDFNEDFNVNTLGRGTRKNSALDPDKPDTEEKNSSDDKPLMKKRRYRIREIYFF